MHACFLRCAWHRGRAWPTRLSEVPGFGRQAYSPPLARVLGQPPSSLPSASSSLEGSATSLPARGREGGLAAQVTSGARGGHGGNLSPGSGEGPWGEVMSDQAGCAHGASVSSGSLLPSLFLFPFSSLPLPSPSPVPPLPSPSSSPFPSHPLPQTPSLPLTQHQQDHLLLWSGPACLAEPHSTGHILGPRGRPPIPPELQKTRGAENPGIGEPQSTESRGLGTLESAVGAHQNLQNMRTLGSWGFRSAGSTNPAGCASSRYPIPGSPPPLKEIY